MSKSIEGRVHREKDKLNCESTCIGLKAIAGNSEDQKNWADCEIWPNAKKWMTPGSCSVGMKTAEAISKLLRGICWNTYQGSAFIRDQKEEDKNPEDVVAAEDAAGSHPVPGNGGFWTARDSRQPGVHRPGGLWWSGRVRHDVRQRLRQLQGYSKTYSEKGKKIVWQQVKWLYVWPPSTLSVLCIGCWATCFLHSFYQS